MYKDKTKQKEAVKKAVEKHRQGITKGITEQGITSNKPEGITLLKRPNGADYNPDELLADGTKRYMGPFTDGQVLDHTTVGLDLTPRNQVAMKAWATATLFTPNKYAQGVHHAPK